MDKNETIQLLERQKEWRRKDKKCRLYCFNTSLPHVGKTKTIFTDKNSGILISSLFSYAFGRRIGWENHHSFATPLRAAI